jgi:hypothetical protein
MGEKRVRVEWDEEPVARLLEDGSEPFGPGWRYVEEWVPEEPRERWSEWRTISSETAADPTYYPTYTGPGLFARIASLNPARRVKIVEERRLLRTWVDSEQGPMAQTVRTETREVTL